MSVTVSRRDARPRGLNHFTDTVAGSSSAPGPGSPVVTLMSVAFVRAMQNVAAFTSTCPSVPGWPARVMLPPPLVGSSTPPFLLLLIRPPCDSSLVCASCGSWSQRRRSSFCSRSRRGTARGAGAWGGAAGTDAIYLAALHSSQGRSRAHRPRHAETRGTSLLGLPLRRGGHVRAAAHARRIERHAVAPEREEDARQPTRQRHARDSLPAPGRERDCPAPQRLRGGVAIAPDTPRGLHQQPAEPLVLMRSGFYRTGQGRGEKVIPSGSIVSLSRQAASNWSWLICEWLRFVRNRFVLARFAPLKSAYRRSAPVRFALARSAPTRSALVRSVPLRFAPTRNPSRRDAPVSFALVRSTPLRLARSSNTLRRSALLTCADVKFAPFQKAEDPCLRGHEGGIQAQGRGWGSVYLGNIGFKATSDP